MIQKIKSNLLLTRKFAFRSQVLFLAAGMQRSGSTWLYNAARLILAHSPEISRQFSFGSLGDLKVIPAKPYMLIKLHEFNKYLAEKSDVILYSYRDIRDVVASLKRKFDSVPTLELSDYLVAQDEKWSAIANYTMRYEDMLHDKATVISNLISELNQQDVMNATDVLTQLEKLSYESPGSKGSIYHNTNQYHQGHITDGRHRSWDGQIGPGLIAQIEKRHEDWFRKRGYFSREETMH
jgi:hypothetical protein